MSEAKKVKGLTRFSWQQILGPILITVGISYFGGSLGPDLMLGVQVTLCFLVMVLALQIFVGNSGVLSFGHGAFAMIGAFVSGLATAPEQIKINALSMNELWQPLVSFKLNTYVSLLVAALVGAIIACLSGILLMRLNGLPAGIATFAILGISYNFFFNNKSVGPGSQALPMVPKFTRLEEPLALAVLAIILVYFFNISRTGRTLRASREDNLAAPALGISVFRVRLIAFTLSGSLAAIAGAMYSHVAGTVQVQDYYLGFTFMTLAMLVIGGSGSLWGSVLGTIVLAVIGQVLLYMEQGRPIFGLIIQIPYGARAIFIALSLVGTLLWRTSGLSQGREFRLPFSARN
jgi:branched-chain amino acid transport system permease protein